MALREERPIWNSSGLTTGQTLAHSPHALQSFGSTKRAFLRILTVKFPT
jgi:hypothetical protein